MEAPVSLAVACLKASSIKQHGGHPTNPIGRISLSYFVGKGLARPLLFRAWFPNRCWFQWFCITWWPGAKSWHGAWASLARLQNYQAHPPQSKTFTYRTPKAPTHVTYNSFSSNEPGYGETGGEVKRDQPRKGKRLRHRHAGGHRQCRERSMVRLAQGRRQRVGPPRNRDWTMPSVCVHYVHPPVHALQL